MKLSLMTSAFQSEDCDLVIHLRMSLILTMSDAANLFIIRYVSYTLLDLKQQLFSHRTAVLKGMLSWTPFSSQLPIYGPYSNPTPN